MNDTPPLPLPLDNDDANQTSPGEKKEILWEVVAKTDGLVTAQILVGRLQAEGLLARAWQEGAGRALGLTVGLLGTGYVMVPKEDVARAKAILEEDVELDFDDDEFEEDYDPGDEPPE